MILKRVGFTLKNTLGQSPIDRFIRVSPANHPPIHPEYRTSPYRLERHEIGEKIMRPIIFGPK